VGPRVLRATALSATRCWVDVSGLALDGAEAASDFPRPDSPQDRSLHWRRSLVPPMLVPLQQSTGKGMPRPALFAVGAIGARNGSAYPAARPAYGTGRQGGSGSPAYRAEARGARAPPRLPHGEPLATGRRGPGGHGDGGVSARLRHRWAQNRRAQPPAHVRDPRRYPGGLQPAGPEESLRPALFHGVASSRAGGV
jgi:hypothetical protein